MSETSVRLLAVLILAGAIVVAAYIHGGMYQMAGAGQVAYKMNKLTGETTYYLGGIERQTHKK